MFLLGLSGWPMLRGLPRAPLWGFKVRARPRVNAGSPGELPTTLPPAAVKPHRESQDIFQRHPIDRFTLSAAMGDIAYQNKAVIRLTVRLAGFFCSWALRFEKCTCLSARIGTLSGPARRSGAARPSLARRPGRGPFFSREKAAPSPLTSPRRPLRPARPVAAS